MTTATMLFNLPDEHGNIFHADEHLPLIVYFYPKDNTPGCTTEALEFSALLPQFKQLGYEVVGISRDQPTSHARFIAKHDLNITLLADVDETVCRLFEVMKEKNMYGKKVWGIERSTFILNTDGQISHSWRKVKAASHATEVLAFIQNHS